MVRLMSEEMEKELAGLEKHFKGVTDLLKEDELAGLIVMSVNDDGEATSSIIGEEGVVINMVLGLVKGILAQCPHYKGDFLNEIAAFDEGPINQVH